MQRTLRFVGIVAAATAICVLNPCSAAGAQAQCDNVTSLEFQSMSIEIPGRGIVQMNHGTGFSSDADPDGMSRDWKITLVQDETLRPASSLSLRLIRFNADHITGSGAWDHVFIYQCRSGELARVFEERYLYGVRIQRVSDSELVFVSGEWTKADPMCCPSREKRSTYKWDSKNGKYVLVATDVQERINGPD